MRYGCYYIMMKKFKGFVISNWKLIVVILLVIIFSVAFWGYIKEMEFRKRVMSLMEIGVFKEEGFIETIEIESNNIVTNRTDNEYYDKIVEVGLYELGIDCVYVRINDITDQAKRNFGMLCKIIFGKKMDYFPYRIFGGDSFIEHDPPK
jgi:hypothetical protein